MDFFSDPRWSIAAAEIIPWSLAIALMPRTLPRVRRTFGRVSVVAIGVSNLLVLPVTLRDPPQAAVAHQKGADSAVGVGRSLITAARGLLQRRSPILQQ